MTSWKEGGVARTIIIVISAIFAGFTEVIALAIRANYLDLAEGIWLTLLAYYVYGVERIGATFATGQVTLVNSGGGVYEFEAGEFVCRNPSTDAHYTNVSAFTLGAGETLTIDIRAVVAGSDGDSSAGQISALVTTMLSVTCSNAAALVGRNEESDPALRQVCRDSLGALSPNGPQAAYEFWAKRAKRADGTTVNVTRVWVSPASSVGHVQVYVAGPNGEISGSAGDPNTDLGAVAATIMTRVVPKGVSCTVASATAVNITVTGTAWVQAAANLSDAAWQDMFKSELDAYLSEAPIGGYVLTSAPGHIHRNALIGVVERVSKFVIKFDPTLPVGDTALAEGEVPASAAHSITVQQVS
ncbi:baseplate J/gp47 family protein [Sorangium sp. So ce128]|uniref:baseplate J/gp47 family protein n=1 Tax=Sorangium sp. So ce128 TaxID=3133281 RepID=UPI003F61EE63